MDQIGMVQVWQAGAPTLEGSGDDSYWSSTTSTYYTVYTYDDLNQLTSAITYPGTYDPDVSPTATSDEEFSFNAIGNLVSDSTGTYSSNDMNEYTGLPSGATIIYNGRGDTTQVGDTLYGYDALDRLVDMQPASPTDGSLDVRYTYDAENRLIQKEVYSWNSDLDGEDDGDAGWNTTPDSSTGYIYDGTEMIGEINVPTAADVGETGYPYDALQETFTWNPQADGGVGGLLSETVRDGSGSFVGSYAPEYDGADNIVGWVDESSGQVVETQTFSAFGIKTVTSDTAISIDGVSVNISTLTPFGYKTMFNMGEENGMGSGLWRVAGDDEDQIRITNSTIGRWMQPDPTGTDGGDNEESYCHNDPINRVDPDGDADLTAAQDNFLKNFSAKISNLSPQEKEAWYLALVATIVKSNITQLKVTYDEKFRKLTDTIDEIKILEQRESSGLIGNIDIARLQRDEQKLNQLADDIAPINQEMALWQGRFDAIKQEYSRLGLDDVYVAVPYNSGGEMGQIGGKGLTKAMEAVQNFDMWDRNFGGLRSSGDEVTAVVFLLTLGGGNGLMALLDEGIGSGGQAAMAGGFTAGEIAGATAETASLRGASSTGPWLSRILAWTRQQALYEAGTKTWPTWVYEASLEDIGDAVTKGILTVDRVGWIRALVPDFTTAYLTTVRQGLTPLAWRIGISATAYGLYKLFDGSSAPPPTTLSGGGR